MNAAPIVRLLHYLAPHKLRVVLAVICSILNMIFDILPEVLIGIAINVVVEKQDSVIAKLGFPNAQDQLLILGALTFLVWSVESILEYAYSILWRNLAQVIQHELRVETYEHIQKLDMAYYENVSTGKLLTILNDDINQLDRFLDGDINKFIQLGTSTVAILAIFFYLAPLVAVFVLIPVPFIFLTAVFFQRKLAPLYFKVREKSGILAARLVNNIMGIVTIKSYTTEEFELERIANDSREYKLANRRVIAVGSAFIPVVRFILAIGFIATMVLGGWLVLNGKLDVGAYSLLVFQTQRFLWPFTELAEMIDDYQRAMASARRVFELLEMPISISGGTERLLLSSIKGDIKLQNVSFVYPDGTEIFNHLSLEIKPRTTVAFIGTTGTGKSTIIKLLLRFYDPTKGRILLDGHDIKDLCLEDLRQAIGLVSQDVFLFHGTVYENIAYGSLHADRETVMQAAKKAEAHDFILELPDGYETMIGERGQRLSGGQRQRISIARALLKNPPIFIFDEATSALDIETEKLLQRSLQKLTSQHTIIMIAHRLSTIRAADTIFVLQQGAIVESGNHAELMSQKGIYDSLWRVQTGEL